MSVTLRETTALQVTVRCGHCDHELATYTIDPADRPRTEAKYKWQHLACSFCHKTMGPKISIAPVAPAVPVVDAVETLTAVDDVAASPTTTTPLTPAKA